MSASSMAYWNPASAVQDALNGIAATGNEMYAALENNDDPAEVADFLDGIEKRLSKLATEIAPNVTAIRKVAKAMSEVPGVRAS